MIHWDCVKLIRNRMIIFLLVVYVLFDSSIYGLCIASSKDIHVKYSYAVTCTYIYMDTHIWCCKLSQNYSCNNLTLTTLFMFSLVQLTLYTIHSVTYLMLFQWIHLLKCVGWKKVFISLNYSVWSFIGWCNVWKLSGISSYQHFQCSETHYGRQFIHNFAAMVLLIYVLFCWFFPLVHFYCK